MVAFCHFRSIPTWGEGHQGVFRFGYQTLMPLRYVPDRYVLERSSWDYASFVCNMPSTTSPEQWVPTPTRESSSAALYAGCCIILMQARPLAVPFSPYNTVVKVIIIVKQSGSGNVIQCCIAKGRSIQGAKKYQELHPGTHRSGNDCDCSYFFSLRDVCNLCPNSAGHARFFAPRYRTVPEFIDPRFRENKPKTLVFSHRKRAFWACFRENWVYNFGHCYLFTTASTPGKLSNKEWLNSVDSSTHGLTN